MRRKNKMKKVFSLLLAFVLIACLVPLSSVPVFGATQITNVNVTYNAKSVAVRTDMTGRQVTEALQSSLSRESADGGTHIDVSSCCLAKRTGSGMVSYRDFERLDESDEYINTTDEYYFFFNLEENDGYVFGESTLPTVTVNDAAAYASWYSESFTGPEGSVDVIFRVYAGNDDYVSSVTVSPERALVQKGKSCQLTADVVGSDRRLTWAFVETPSSSATRVRDGLVQIGADETVSPLTVVAMSMYNPDIYDTASIYPVDHEVNIEKVTISPSAVSLRRGEPFSFDIQVIGTDFPDYETEIFGQQSEDTRIYGRTLYIDSDETASTIRVRATAVRDRTKYAEAVVTVLPQDIISSISISFDDSSIASLPSSMSGSEITGLLREALRGAVLSEGIHIDRASCALAKRTGSGMVSYQDFVRLDESEEPLEYGREYYYFINLENDDGYLFPNSLPSATVNGSAAEGVSWYSNSFTGPDGSVDVIIKATITGWGAEIKPISFDPVQEGYTSSDLMYKQIKVVNTGTEVLNMGGSSIWVSNPSAFTVIWDAVPSAIPVGEYTSTVYLIPKTGLSAGTYETDVCFRDIEGHLDTVSTHVTFRVLGEPGDLTVIPYPSGAYQEGIDYWIEGNTLTVNRTEPFKVGYWDGDKYVPLHSTDNGDGTHSFSAGEHTQLVMVMTGDVSLDGKISLLDSTMAKSYYNRAVTGLGLTPVQLFACDVNSDDQVKLADSTRIKAVYNNRVTGVTFDWY